MAHPRSRRKPDGQRTAAQAKRPACPAPPAAPVRKRPDAPDLNELPRHATATSSRCRQAPKEPSSSAPPTGPDAPQDHHERPAARRPGHPHPPARWDAHLLLLPIAQSWPEADTGLVSPDEEPGGSFHLHGAERQPMRLLGAPSWAVQPVESWSASELQENNDWPAEQYPGGYFSARLAVLQVVGGEPGQLGPVGYPELRVSPRKVHLDRIARYEQLSRDVGIAQSSAGKLDHLTFNGTEAEPSMRGARVLPAAPLGVGDGLLER